MKKILLLLFIMFYTGAFAQSVSITNDGSAPDNSAILDVKSTVSGLLIPRMTMAQRNHLIGSDGIAGDAPSTGLMIYQTDSTNGFWYFNGTVWVQLSRAQGLGAGTATGNTTYWNGSQWVLNSSNIYNAGGNVGIGTTKPNGQLTIRSNSLSASPFSIQNPDSSNFIGAWYNQNGLYTGFTINNPYGTGILEINGIGDSWNKTTIQLQDNPNYDSANVFRINYENNKDLQFQFKDSNNNYISPMTIIHTGGIQVNGGNSGWQTCGNINWDNNVNHGAFFTDWNDATYITSAPANSGAYPIILMPSQNSNVGIGTTAPDASAKVDIVSANSGLLIPQIPLTSSTDANTIGAPATSLLVYNPGIGGLMPAGYYYNAGSSSSPNWVQMAVAGTTGNTNSWFLTGNSGTIDSTNFIGTTDNVPLNFRVHNTNAGRIDSAWENTFFGFGTGAPGSAECFSNTAFGQYALCHAITYGWGNVAIGNQTLNANTSGTGNTAIGSTALLFNTTGSSNVAIGINTLWRNATGGNNISIGEQSLFNNITGNGNIAVGNFSLHNSNGNSNIAIGYSAGDSGNWNNMLFIDNRSRGDSASVLSKSLIVGSFGADSSAQEVRINGKVQISDGTQASGKVFTSDANGVGSWQTGAATISEVTGATTLDNTAEVWYLSGTASIFTLPDASSCPNRRYILVAAGVKITTSLNYYNLMRTLTSTVDPGTSVEIMSDGANWLQIK